MGWDHVNVTYSPGCIVLTHVDAKAPYDPDNCIDEVSCNFGMSGWNRCRGGV